MYRGSLKGSMIGPIGVEGSLGFRAFGVSGFGDRFGVKGKATSSFPTCRVSWGTKG